MKKFIPIILLLLFLSSTITSCSIIDNQSNNNSEVIDEKDNPDLTTGLNKTPYKDGTYVGKSPITDSGQEEAIVTIKSGKISNIKLKVLDRSGKEINYNNHTAQMANGIANLNIKKYKETFEKEIIEKQSTSIPSISEIEEISNNWKISINNALEESKKDSIEVSN